jgi:hypothetical protein
MPNYREQFEGGFPVFENAAADMTRVLVSQLPMIEPYFVRDVNGYGITVFLPMRPAPAGQIVGFTQSSGWLDMFDFWLLYPNSMPGPSADGYKPFHVPGFNENWLDVSSDRDVYKAYRGIQDRKDNLPPDRT